MTIELTELQVEAIRDHASSAYPEECCGFLVGSLEDDARRVSQLEPVRNHAPDDELNRRFRIGGEDFMAAEKRARAGGKDIIGFYHSHPNSAARPSEFDRDHAWPWYSYVIVSIDDRGPQEMTSWILDEESKQFNEEQMICTRT